MARNCPRCNDSRTEKASDSPVKGAWEVYRCQHCNYVWRSTENLSDIYKYDQSMVDRVVPNWPLPKGPQG